MQLSNKHCLTFHKGNNMQLQFFSSVRDYLSISNRYFADISTRGSSHRNAVISTQQQKVTRKPNHFHSVSSTYKMSSALTLTCHTGLRPSLNA